MEILRRLAHLNSKKPESETRRRVDPFIQADVRL